MSRAILFVGHGGVPTDFPRREVMELKRLEGERHRTSGPVTAEEATLDEKLRNWPRTSETDPYLHGFESLATALRQRVACPVYTAYNEFCGPTIEQAVSRAYSRGVTDLAVITTMLTPGGSHAALEIPEVLAACRVSYPAMKITYAWPFPVDAIATFLASHVNGAWSSPH